MGRIVEAQQSRAAKRALEKDDRYHDARQAMEEEQDTSAFANMPDPEPELKSAYQAAIDTLERNLRALEETARDLVERLAPVLIQENGEVCHPSGQSASSPSLITDIARINDRVELITRVLNVADRLVI